MSDKPTIEAEVIPTQAVAVRQSGGLTTIQDMDQQFAVAVHQRELLADYIKKQLKPGKHFYQRGDQKPSLSKEGAEIILLPHNLCPDYQQTGGPTEPPDNGRPYQITVKCILRVKGNPDSFVGSGIGSAGSEKGFWNKTTREWEYQPRQTDKYLCHNATLKMAQKSAMIAATINSTAASEFFTQDMDEPGSPPPSETKEKPKPAPAASPAKPKEKTDAYRTAFIKHIGPNLKDKAVQFLIDLRWILSTEGLEDLSLVHVPDSKEQLEVFMNCLKQYVDDGTVVVPYGEGVTAPSVPHGIEVPRDKNIDPDSPDAPWRKFPVPFGKHAGTKLADLDKNVLYGFWANFKAEETWTDNRGQVRNTKPDKLEKDRKFREMLNEAGAHYEFTAPEDDLNY